MGRYISTSAGGGCYFSGKYAYSISSALLKTCKIQICEIAVAAGDVHSALVHEMFHCCGASTSSNKDGEDQAERIETCINAEIFFSTLKVKVGTLSNFVMQDVPIHVALET